MSDVVFILGAGASRECGGPLMFDFLDIASDLLRSRQVENGREHFERVRQVISRLQAVHSKAQLDLNNIESIFTVLELGKIIQSVPNTPINEIPTIIASLKKVIVRTLEEKSKFPVRDRTIGAPAAYQAFARVLTHLVNDAHPKQSVSVITFNYDVAIDVAMFRAGLEPNYRLEDKNRGPVDLLKLHGSLNWATETDEKKKIHPLHISDYFGKYSVNNFGETGNATLPIGSAHLVEYFKGAKNPIAVHPEPVIVPPSWNKSEYHQALSNVWAAAAKHLSEADNIFVLGYSLPETDSFFRHLYALGSVGPQVLRRFTVFDPDEPGGGVDQRFRALLGSGATARYSYVQRKFSEALGYIPDLFPRRR